MYVLAAFCMIYFFFQKEWPKVLEAVLIVAVLLGIRFVVWKTKTELFSALRFSILFFIIITMFLANMFGFYGVIPYLDDVEHLLSGVILSFVGLLMFRKLDKTEESASLRATNAMALWFSLFFAIAMAGCWEMYEFSLDQLFGLNSQGGSLVDSMVDIICGTVGAVATSLYLILIKKRS